MNQKGMNQKGDRNRFAVAKVLKWFLTRMALT